MAEVRVPTPGPDSVVAPRRATFLRVDGDYAVYSVASGSYTFRATVA
jgi:alpha-L-rhamnosidase